MSSAMPLWSQRDIRDGVNPPVLREGLATLGATFAADICPLCDGAGSRRQRYTAGCGMGDFSMNGTCDYCDGYGLVQHGKPAPSSVVNQVILAGGGKVGR